MTEILFDTARYGIINAAQVACVFMALLGLAATIYCQLAGRRGWGFLCWLVTLFSIVGISWFRPAS